jgi:hypothetical protein
MNRLAAYIVVLAVLVTAAASLNAAIQAFNIHIQKLPIRPESGLTLPSLPREVDGFALAFESPPLSAEIQRALGTDNYLSRTYIEQAGSESERGRTIEFHAAYYTGMIDTVPHVPERCFVGSGEFAIDGRTGQVVPVPLDLDRFSPDPDADPEVHGEILRGRTSNSSDAPGVRVRMPRDIEDLRMNVTRFIDPRGTKLHAGYFFIANGGTVPRAGDVRSLAFDSQSTHAYYMKVQFTSSDVEDAAELAELSASFLDEILPDLMRRTPDWVDVLDGRHPATRDLADAGSAD